ncbi:hypothetical protein HDZ31DRAFT_50520, partial [Schizophyllum fasciatum]
FCRASQGCPSAGLSRPSKRRISSRITTYEEAKSTCGPRESVCGIPGREGTFDFECIDTSSTLDSCGGCVTPHSFPVSGSQSLGVDCAALPNVIEVGCKASKCVVNRCKGAFAPSEDGSRCASTASKRQLNLGLLSNTDVDTTANLDSSINDQLLSTIKLVVQLGDIASTTGTAAGPAASAGTGTTSSSGVDVNGLIDDTLKATGALLGSATVSDLVAGTNDLLAKTNAVIDGLTASTSSGALLDLASQIVIDLNILIGTMSQQPITSPPPPATSPSNPSPVKNPDGGDIRIDLNNLLGKLGLGGLLNVGTIDITGLGPGLSTLVQGLVDALSLGPVTSSDPSGKSGVKSNSTDVSAVVDADVLANITAIVDIVLRLGGDDSVAGGSASSPQTVQVLVDTLLNVTADLLVSATLTDLVVNLNDVDRTVHLLNNAGVACGCLNAAVNDLLVRLVLLTDATLDHVDSHPITTPPAGGSSSSSGSSGTSTTTSDGGQIIIDLTTLLTALGLGGLLDVGTVEVDGLGPNLSGFVQKLVNGLSLGPR